MLQWKQEDICDCEGWYCAFVQPHSGSQIQKRKKRKRKRKREEEDEDEEEDDYRSVIKKIIIRFDARGGEAAENKKDSHSPWKLLVRRDLLPTSRLETFGGWDKEAIEFLKKIATKEARRWGRNCCQKLLPKTLNRTSKRQSCPSYWARRWNAGYCFLKDTFLIIRLVAVSTVFIVDIVSFVS